MSKYAQLKLKLKEIKQNEPLKVEVCVNYKDTYKNEINDLNLTHLKTVNMNDLSLDTIITTLIEHRFFYDNARPCEFSIEAINHPEYGIVLAVIFDIYNMVDYFIRPLNQNELQEQQPTVKESCKTVEPQTIKEETQEPTKKAQIRNVVEVIKNQLSNIKEVTTKNEHYYKIHLDNNYMITAFYSNCKKCYKVTLFDMSKSPKNGENKVVHTLKLQDLTNFKEVYNFCQIVEKQTQEQPTTKESCKTVESLLALDNELSTELMKGGNRGEKHVGDTIDIVPMSVPCELESMVDIIMAKNNTDKIQTENITITQDNTTYRIHVHNNNYVIEFKKNTLEVVGIYENDFGFECGLSLATKEGVFTPLMENIMDEVQIVFNRTAKATTFEESVKENKKERNRGMELIYNIVINNIKGFTDEENTSTITRHFKLHDNETCFNGNYNYMFTYSYEWYAKKWEFTLVNKDCVIVLNRGIHKSLLNEKWLLNLCKQVNDIINETK